MPDTAPDQDVQAAIEAREAAELAEKQAAISTLTTLFPTSETSVLEMVLLAHNGDLARAIDALLEMS